MDFEYQVAGDSVRILRGGVQVTTLRGKSADTFLAKVTGAPAEKQQQLMARATGNYKRGNERAARNHPRNR